MAVRNGVLVGAIAAQALGQAVAGWGLMAHVVDSRNSSPRVVVPLVASIAVPFRHDGSFRDRATGNFSAAVVLAGLLAWEVALGVLTNGGLELGLVATLMLVSTVLFCVAGTFFWVLRGEKSHRR